MPGLRRVSNRRYRPKIRGLRQLAHQALRKRKPMTNTTAKNKSLSSSILFGMLWGVLMLLIIGVFEPLYYDQEITTRTLRDKAMLWIPGGITFGFVQYLWTARKRKAD